MCLQDKGKLSITCPAGQVQLLKYFCPLVTLVYMGSDKQNVLALNVIIFLYIS